MLSSACAICSEAIASRDLAYPNAVCQRCGARAVLADGSAPAWDSTTDSGDNPVYIGEHRCWRRYKPGGFITMCDPWDADDEADFYALAGGQDLGARVDVNNFGRLLREPPAAVMLGLDAQELAHNCALDAVLNSEVGPDFVRAIAGQIAELAAAGAVDVPFTSHWRAIAEAKALAVRGSYQPKVGEGRCDEIVHITADGLAYEVVVELKVEATPDGEQLRTYLRERRAETQHARVLGILLVVGDLDMELDADGLAHLGTAQLIRALVSCVSPRTPRRLRQAVNDYRRSATFLFHRDVLIIRRKIGEEWRTGKLIGPIKTWVELERNRRWVHRRIGREVERRLSTALPAYARKVSLNDDHYGTSVDLWLHEKDYAMPARGRLFVKWRIQYGVDVHAGAWEVPVEQARQIVRAARDRFRAPLETALARYGSTDVSHRRGRSGAIVMVRGPELATLDPERVLAGLREVSEVAARALGTA